MGNKIVIKNGIDRSGSARNPSCLGRVTLHIGLLTDFILFFKQRKPL